MIFKNGNFTFKNGSNILSAGESFVLKVTGNRFPLVTDVDNMGIFNLIFSTNTTVTVNYGNGYIATYSTTSNNFYMYDKGANSFLSPPGYGIPAYNYPDGLNIERTVSISFNRSLLRQFIIQLMLLKIGDLYFEFSKYPNLTRFSAAQLGPSQNGALLNLNFSNAALLPGLTTVEINSAFHSTSPNYSQIPLPIFSMPITVLAVGGYGYRSFASCNFDKIALLANSLTTLTIQAVSFTDNWMGDGSLPANFSSLTKLTYIRLFSSAHATIPNVLNSILSLTTIEMGYMFSLNNWGSLPALSNVTALFIDTCPNLPATVPAYFANWTKLKQWRYRGQTGAGKLDTWIAAFYNFVVANAAMTGSSTLQFRGMSMNVSSAIGGDGTPIPSGTYQAPAGFVLGSSNGAPASSLEMIYVLVNQYLHTWSYRTV